VIEQLLGDLEPARFVGEYYTRLPHSRPGGARGFTSFDGWSSIERILTRPDVDAFLAREGRLFPEPGPPSHAKARELYAQGYTLVIRRSEAHDPELARLARGFGADFGAAVNVHIYATPPQMSGFGWHYDPEDVFIVQTHGTKEYLLRKNTVHPWPILETMPRDQRYEREGMPVFSCLLSEGDWLYIPTGWWHQARAIHGSITLAIGLMTPTALDVLDFLRKELADSIVWRQRLPVVGQASGRTPEDLARQHEVLFRELGKDLARHLGEPEAARRFLSPKPGPGKSPP
jgi:ribosomal protein L16 Arg81 hydroxylase